MPTDGQLALGALGLTAVLLVASLGAVLLVGEDAPPGDETWAFVDEVLNGTSIVASSAGAVNGSVGADGGVVANNGTDPGSPQWLTLPAGALAELQLITLDPVANVTGWGVGIRFVAGAMFGPDGLGFATPVTWSIPIPADVDAGRLLVRGLDHHGRLGLPLPWQVENATLVVTLRHFSGVAVGERPAEVTQLETVPCGYDAGAYTERYLSERTAMEQLARILCEREVRLLHDSAAEMQDLDARHLVALRTWYDLGVDEHTRMEHPTLESAVKMMREYLNWEEAVGFAGHEDTFATERVVASQRATTHLEAQLDVHGATCAAGTTRADLVAYATIADQVIDLYAYLHGKEHIPDPYAIWTRCLVFEITGPSNVVTTPEGHAWPQVEARVFTTVGRGEIIGTSFIWAATPPVGATVAGSTTHHREVRTPGADWHGYSLDVGLTGTIDRATIDVAFEMALLEDEPNASTVNLVHQHSITLHRAPTVHVSWGSDPDANLNTTTFSIHAADPLMSLSWRAESLGTGMSIDRLEITGARGSTRCGAATPWAETESVAGGQGTLARCLNSFLGDDRIEPKGHSRELRIQPFINYSGIDSSLGTGAVLATTLTASITHRWDEGSHDFRTDVPSDEGVLEHFRCFDPSAYIGTHDLRVHIESLDDPSYPHLMHATLTFTSLDDTTVEHSYAIESIHHDRLVARFITEGDSQIGFAEVEPTLTIRQTEDGWELELICSLPSRGLIRVPAVEV